MYSQNNEDKFILDFWKSKNDVVGSILEIGANDGKTLSNSLAFIEEGWSAYLIEPNESSFKKLQKLHETNKRVKTYNFGIDTISGKKKYFESGKLLGSEDHSLVSCIDEKETLRWRGVVDFKESEAIFLTWDDFLENDNLTNAAFNVISIDAEGHDWNILQQIDLVKHQCEVLCVEWNGVNAMDIIFSNYAGESGLKEIYRNAENIIFAK
jgi:FkbM family methyltransferase